MTAINIQNCYSCWSTNLLHLQEDITCGDCGCEQGIGPEHIITYDVHQQMEPMTSKEENQVKKLTHEFDLYESILHQPNSVIEVAKDLLQAYTSKKGSIRTSDKSKYVVAAIYFASRRFIPLLRKRILDSCFLSPHEFSAACTDIKDGLAGTTWDALFSKCDNVNTTINSFVNNLKLTTNDNIALRKKINTILDRIECDQTIKDMHPSTLATGIIYVAARSANYKHITMSTINKISNITMTSITTAQRLVLEALKNKRT